MSSGLPKWTRPISIAGISIASLPIDIVAQTVGNISIDIAAQTMGNIAVNIAASAVTLNVDVVAQTVGNLGVDIKAQTIGNLAIDIAAQTLGNVAISIAAQVVDLNIKTSGGVNIVIDQLTQTAYTERRTTSRNDNEVTTPTPPPSSATGATYRGKFFPRAMRGMLRSIYCYCKRTAAGTLTVAYAPYPGASEVGSVTITPGAAWDWKYGNIFTMWNYDGLFIWIKSCDADVSWGYDVGPPNDQYISVDAGVTWYGQSNRLFVRPRHEGQTVGDVPVSGFVNVKDIDTSINVPIDIKVQTVDLDIKTSGGVNIVIDKLTQTAYTARTASIVSHGTAEAWASYTGVNRTGKFFPRGARGFLNVVNVRCRDAGAVGGTITVYVAPYIGAGYLYSADITVPAGGGEAWRTATFNVMWEYDSLFIWILSSTANMHIAWDTATPPDWWGSTDSGATWLHVSRRPHFYAVVQGESIGDIPVSGTVNVIEIPHSSSEQLDETWDLTGGWDLVHTVHGEGFCDLAYAYCTGVNAQVLQLRLLCDGVQAFSEQVNTLGQRGYSMATPGIQVERNVDGACVMQTTKKFEFRRLFEVYVSGPGALNARVVALVNLVK